MQEGKMGMTFWLGSIFDTPAHRPVVVVANVRDVVRVYTLQQRNEALLVMLLNRVKPFLSEVSCIHTHYSHPLEALRIRVPE